MCIRDRPHAIDSGVSFDASAIAGFGNVVESDLFLVPDLDTFSILPWRPAESGVGRFFCHIKYPDGRPFEGDGRYLLGDVYKRQPISCGPSCPRGRPCRRRRWSAPAKPGPALW